jgi:mevalonate kinase
MTPTTHASGRAYGKLILLGEHAVVYGVPALVAGVGMQLVADAEVVEASGCELALLSRRCRADAGAADELARAFAALLDEGGAPDSLRVQVSGELPPGVGLGFSAAAAVAIARAVEGLGSERVDVEAVRARAMAWEGVYHGNPSGVDVAAAIHGGCLRFVRGVGVTPVRVGAPLTLAVGLTGTRSSTKEMVAGVARLRDVQAEVFDKSLEGIRSLVERGIGAVEDGDVRALGELMDMNQMILAGMLLSTDALEELCDSARKAGALGAKLTGAGGGGAMVALAGTGPEADEVAAAIVRAYEALGYQGFACVVGVGAEEAA